ncbi:MAG: hypothetical protein SVT52_01390, partial [Planctomycetota bacterium]|nr:hypothetical protein [Planctomycetota bacterium]
MAGKTAIWQFVLGVLVWALVSAAAIADSPCADPTRPEPIVFMLMRSLAATPAGTASYELRRQIDRWQSFAHDQKRKVGGNWLSPEDFQRRRRAYAEHLKQVQSLAHNIRRIRGDEPADLAERKQLRGRLNAKLIQAAKTPTDPLLRNFLLAVAQLQTGRAGRAEAAFRQCARQAPTVAGFHQGRALALQQLDRHTDALAECIRVLELRPTSREALYMLQDTMKKVPGSDIRTETYTAAGKLLGRYENPKHSKRRGRAWLMPGGDWLVRNEMLPDLPYDRLVFRQALGVPIGKRTLMVDAGLADGAVELLVRIGEKTLVPAYVRRTGSYGRTGKRPVLAFLSVEDIEFTPLKTG